MVLCVLLARLRAVWPVADMAQYALWVALGFPVLNTYLLILLGPNNTWARGGTSWVMVGLMALMQMFGALTAVYLGRVCCDWPAPSVAAGNNVQWVCDEILGVFLYLAGITTVFDARLDIQTSLFFASGVSMSTAYGFPGAHLNLVVSVFYADKISAVETGLRVLGGFLGLMLAYFWRFGDCLVRARDTRPIAPPRVDEIPLINNNSTSDMFKMHSSNMFMDTKFKSRL